MNTLFTPTPAENCVGEDPRNPPYPLQLLVLKFFKKSKYHTWGSVSSSRLLDAPVEEEHALVWRIRNSASLAGGVVGAGFAPGARFRRGGLADVALASRFLQHVLHLVQFSLVVLLGEVFSDEGGVGGGGDVGGGEAEDVSDFFARIVVRVLAVLPRMFLEVRESGFRWIIRRARNTRESLYSWPKEAIP